LSGSLTDPASPSTLFLAMRADHGQKHHRTTRDIDHQLAPKRNWGYTATNILLEPIEMERSVETGILQKISLHVLTEHSQEKTTCEIGEYKQGSLNIPSQYPLSIRFFQYIPFSLPKPLQNHQILGTIICMIVPPHASFGIPPL
jgi:hypothetical protein